jgi:hypothetical protein
MSTAATNRQPAQPPELRRRRPVGISAGRYCWLVQKCFFLLTAHSSLLAPLAIAAPLNCHLKRAPNSKPEFRQFFGGTSAILTRDPAYERTVEFCAKYDEVSFDPTYPNEPLSTFEPMVRKLLAKNWAPPE